MSHKTVPCREYTPVYSLGMSAYEEIVDFIAAGPSTGDVAGFQASPELKARVVELLDLEKSGIATKTDIAELEHYLELEHLMRLAKARARERLAHA